jgi:hypothetical protein
MAQKVHWDKDKLLFTLNLNLCLEEVIIINPEVPEEVQAIKVARDLGKLLIKVRQVMVNKLAGSLPFSKVNLVIKLQTEILAWIRIQNSLYSY